MIKQNNMYKNTLLHKDNVLKDTKNKIGVYRWINRITNDIYVGSSKNIGERLKNYYSVSYLKNKLLLYNSRIYKALLEYGYSNFDMEILEYCDIKSLLEREQYYIDLYKPEYNICKIAGSMLGFRHSPETLLKLKNRISVTAHLTIVINIKDNSQKKYSSIRSAARDIGISPTTLLRYSNNNKLLNNIYIIDICKPIL
jgi:hypothetical protein